MYRPVVERGWVKICSVRPDQCVNFRIDVNLIEDRQVPQWAKKLAGQNGLKVDYLIRTIIEVHAQRVRSFDLK